MLKYRKTGALTAATLTLVVTFGATSIASASTQQDVSEEETVIAGMGLVGFDAEAAAQNGYEIRTTSEGTRQYSVPIGTPEDFVPQYEDTAPAPGLSASPLGSRTSNCGSSWIALTKTTVSTGYTVRAGVLYSKWGTTVSSPGAFDDINFDHGSTTAWWQGTANISSSHRGAGGATVNPGSYALLTDGGLCQSLLPTENCTW